MTPLGRFFGLFILFCAAAMTSPAAATYMHARALRIHFAFNKADSQPYSPASAPAASSAAGAPAVIELAVGAAAQRSAPANEPPSAHAWWRGRAPASRIPLSAPPQYALVFIKRGKVVILSIYYLTNDTSISR